MNEEKFERALDACRMRKIFNKYNVGAKDLKPGKFDGWIDCFMCDRGNLTFVYVENNDEAYVSLGTNVGDFHFHVGQSNRTFWFFLKKNRVSKEDLLKLDVDSILEVVSLIGGEIYLAPDYDHRGYFNFIDGNRNEQRFELNDLPLLFEYSEKVFDEKDKKKAKLKELQKTENLNLKSMIVNINGLPRLDIKKLQPLLESIGIEFDGNYQLDQDKLVDEILDPFLKKEGLSYIVAAGFFDIPFCDSSGEYSVIFPWRDSYGRDESSMIVDENEVDNMRRSVWLLFNDEFELVEKVSEARIAAPSTDIARKVLNQSGQVMHLPFIYKTQVLDEEESWYDTRKLPKDYDVWFIDHVYQ